MSEGDNGASEGPAKPSMPAAAPRPKPSVPGAAPSRPGTSGRANPPPPVPTRAKEAPPPPPPLDANPFLPPESSSKIDAGWPALDDTPESLEPVPEPAPPPQIPPPPPRMVEPTEQAPIAAGDAEPAKTESVGKLESPSEPPPFKKRSRGKVLAFVFLAVVILGGAGFAYQSELAARSARTQAAAPQTTQTTAEPVRTAEPAPPPTYTAEPPPSASAVAQKPATGGAAPAVSIDPAARAFLDATQLPPGRKIMVDGRVVGTSPRKVAIRCGGHRIQIGDQPPESIDFPCGGEVSFTE